MATTLGVYREHAPLGESPSQARRQPRSTCFRAASGPGSCGLSGRAPQPEGRYRRGSPSGPSASAQNGAPQLESAALGGRWNPMNAP